MGFGKVSDLVGKEVFESLQELTRVELRTFCWPLCEYSVMPEADALSTAPGDLTTRDFAKLTTCRMV